MLFALAHPTRVSRLALVAPAAGTREDREAFERRFAERSRAPGIVAARDALTTSGLRERDAELYRRRMFELSVAGYFKDPADAAGLTPFRVTGRTQDAVWQSLGDYDFTAELAALDLPCLIIHGRYDPIPQAAAERSARALKARLEIFPESGHAPHVEETERFVSVLDAFLPRA